MTMESREGDARDACKIAALIRPAPTSDPIPCTITDISERGARLMLDADIELPDHFTLDLPLLDDQYDRRPVELRWRRGTMIGVLFQQRQFATES